MHTSTYSYICPLSISSINELSESTMKVRYPSYVSSCYLSNSTLSSATTSDHKKARTETTRPPISPKRISLIRSSTPIAPGRSFLLAKTSRGTDWSEGRPRSACNSDVAVGRDLVWIDQFNPLSSGICRVSMSMTHIRCVDDVPIISTTFVIRGSTHNIASAPRQYLSHIPLNLGWP
jgi:hypothetical protein